jgi:UDP-N-acetylglucosamine 4,6-dehydratase
MSKYFSELSGKRIVVTGGVGSVGREIVTKLATSEAAHVRVIDNNESGLFDMEMEMGNRSGGPVIDFFHCDITDEREMRRTFTARRSSTFPPASEVRFRR